MQNIAPLNNTQNIRVCEFIRITYYTSSTDPGTTLAFSNFTQDYTDATTGITYQGFGPWVNVSQQQRDLKASSADTTITAVGIDPAFLQIVQSGNIKGALVWISRGFFDSNYLLQGNILYRRFTGTCTGYDITENLASDKQSRIINLMINCSSFERVLDNKNGRFTNPSSWNNAYPSDTSMRRVPQLQNVQFDFGKKV